MKRLDRNEWLIAAGIFAVALAVRLLFLFGSPDRAWPHSLYYEGDAPQWVEWARLLHRGEPFEADLPLRSPAVAFLLHWISPGELSGPFTGYKILWCVFTSLAAALMYLAVVMVFSRRIALIATGLYVFSFGSHVISTSLNNEAMYTLLLMGTVLATLEVIRRPAWALAIALAVLHGLAMLTRPEHMLLVALMTAYVAWAFWRGSPAFPISTVAVAKSSRRNSQSKIQNPKSKIALLAIILFGSIVVCLPWSIRGSLATQRFNTVSADVPDFANAVPRWSPEARAFIESLPAFAQDPNFRYISYLAHEARRPRVEVGDVIVFFTQFFDHVPQPLPRWSLISIKGPLDFALANHPQSQGEFSKAALAMPGEDDPAIHFARPDQVKLFNRGYQVGWEYISSDFGGWLTIVRAKLSNFFEGAMLGFTSRNLPLGLEGKRRPVDLFTPDPHIAWFLVAFALFTGGVVVCIRRGTGGIWLLIIGYKLIVTILFYGYARQAVSILPAFFLLMALSVDAIAAWLGTKWTPPRALTIVAGAVLLAIVFAVDFTGSLHRPAVTVTGPLYEAPQWGEGAIQSHRSLRFTREPGPSP